MSHWKIDAAQFGQCSDTRILDLAGGGLGMDGVASFVGITTQPLRGSRNSNGNGTCTYVPNVSNGHDAFSIAYQSSAGNTQVFTIQVTIGDRFLPGDVNLDVSLDIADISQFIAGWGSDTTGLSDSEKIMLGDLNRDGQTNFSDFFLLRQARQDQLG